MGKALFWTGVFFVVIFITRLLAVHAAKKRQSPPQAPSQANAPVADSEAMVRCAHCGEHLPRSEASLIEQNTWCTPAHAKLGARPQD